MSLHDIRYDGGAMAFASHHTHAAENAFERYFEEAERIRRRAEEDVPAMEVEPTPLEDDFERMRWFPLAHDVVARMREAVPVGD